MTREEIEKALDPFLDGRTHDSQMDEYSITDLIDFAFSCCARQAEEDAKIAEEYGSLSSERIAAKIRAKVDK